MKTNYDLPLAVARAVTNDPDRYLPVAFLALGAHADKIPTEAIEGLIAMLEYELRERAYEETEL